MNHLRTTNRFLLLILPWCILRAFSLALLLMPATSWASGSDATVPGSAQNIESPALVNEPLPSYFRTGILDFESRVWAQTQIERVFYSNRLWPKENPGLKPPFEQMVSAALIKIKAADVLRMSATLKQYWNIEITPPILQTELDRMERESRNRAVLHELFAALRNDPFLIAETLARNNLTEKALRNRYAFDASLHVSARHRVEVVATRVKNGADWSGLDTAYSLRRMQRKDDTVEARGAAPAREQDVIRLSEKELADLRQRLAMGDPGVFREEENGYLFERMVSEDSRGLEMESLFIPKRSFDEWWAHAAPQLMTEAMPAAAERGAFRLPVPGFITAGGCDVWDGGNNLSPSPGQRDFHTAIWTGSEMIVWGGAALTMNSGSRYNPAIDSWIATSIGANVPEGRYRHTAVWTGSEMIVWGGSPVLNSYLNTGGRYNPATNTWIATSLDVNVPAARNYHTAVWTGSEMIIWGGFGGPANFNTGGRYNPVTDTWVTTSIGNNVPEARNSHTAVWTGGEMIVWGGLNSPSYLNSGGRYNPATDSWLFTSIGMNVPVGRRQHTAVWTGSVMIVWAGFSPANLNTGGRYNPATDSWLPTSIGANVPAARYELTAIWTGNEMIVWGGTALVCSPGCGMVYFNSGGRYNPSTDSWQPTSTGANVPQARSAHTAVWTGSEMIAWGGSISPARFNTGGRYNPETNTWITTSIGVYVPAASRNKQTAVWTGSEMIVWGGVGYFAYLNTGGRYNPATDNWTPTSIGVNVPEARNYPTAVWTGREMIVWGGYNGAFLNSGGRYNPATDTWITTSIGASAPVARSDHTAIWTGYEMIVWGGSPVIGSYLNTGGRYNPATDSWLPTSIGANVPAARYEHTAIWTGNEMIVWGGTAFVCSPGCGTVFFNSGGRYNLSTDSWQPTSTGANVPQARSAHTAVWTGSEMIVWGGYNGVNMNTGSRYNPSTDSWQPTSTGAIVPQARSTHTAIWTGSELIVWGGWVGAETNTGGRYNPAADTWITTSIGTNVPAARHLHGAIWTGIEMIVWGGGVNLNSGGIYTSGSVPSPGNLLRGGKSPGVCQLSWGAVFGAGSYNINRCDPTTTGCIPATIVSTPTIPQYSEPDDGQSHFYAVEAVNQCGATP